MTVKNKTAFWNLFKSRFLKLKPN